MYTASTPVVISNGLEAGEILKIFIMPAMTNIQPALSAG
jgi:hypothetical protein